MPFDKDRTARARQVRVHKEGVQIAFRYNAPFKGPADAYAGVARSDAVQSQRLEHQVGPHAKRVTERIDADYAAGFGYICGIIEVQEVSIEFEFQPGSIHHTSAAHAPVQFHAIENALHRAEVQVSMRHGIVTEDQVTRDTQRHRAESVKDRHGPPGDQRVAKHNVQTERHLFSRSIGLETPANTPRNGQRVEEGPHILQIEVGQVEAGISKSPVRPGTNNHG